MRISFVKRTIFFDSLLVFFITLAARYAVSVDGALYLASAKSLFSPEFPFQYHLIREPLFPIMLRAVHVLFGSADLSFIFVQASLLVAALRITGRRFFSHKKALQNLFSAFVALNTVTIGYVGTVLQQVLFICALLSLSYWSYGLLFLKISAKRKFIEGAVAGLLCSSLSVLLLPAVLFVSIYVLAIKIFRSRRARNLTFRGVVAAFIPVIFATIFTTGWSFIKYEQLKTNPNPAYPAWIIDYGSSGPVTYPEGRTKNMAIWSLLNVRDDLMAPGIRENVIYGMGITGERCGGGVSQVPEPSYAYTGEYFQMTCKAPWAYNLARSYFKFSFWGLTATLCLSVLLAGYSIVRRNQKLLLALLPGLILIIFYWYRGAGISRYGFPILGTASLGLFVFAEGTIRKIQNRI